MKVSIKASDCHCTRDVYHQSNFPVDGVDDGELDERGENEEGAAEEPVVQHLDVAHLREVKASYVKMIRC